MILTPIFGWAVFVVLGAVLSLYGLIEARRDLVALRAVPRNGRWMVARHQLIRYALRLVMYALSTAAALSLAHPELVAWLLVADRIALALTTASDLVTGAFLRRGVREQLNREGAGS